MKGDAMRATLLVVDVDGVVSPVHPTAFTWGDECVVTNVFGPVLVSPTLASRLEALGGHPQVTPIWLTSWPPKMRFAASAPFPGRSWPQIDLGHHEVGDGRWAKLDALCHWLEGHHAVYDRVVWIDDHLEHRDIDVRRRLGASSVADVVLIAPLESVGITPSEMDLIERACLTPP